MEAIKSINLEIQVFMYNTQEEREVHVKEMEAKGFKANRIGEAMLSKSSLVSEYLNRENWRLIAEFSKVNVESNPDVNYETDVYVF